MNRGNKVLKSLDSTNIKTLYALVEFGKSCLFTSSETATHEHGMLLSLPQLPNETEEMFITRLNRGLQSDRVRHGKPISILVVNRTFDWAYSFNDYKSLHTDLV